MMCIPNANDSLQVPSDTKHSFHSTASRKHYKKASIPNLYEKKSCLKLPYNFISITIHISKESFLFPFFTYHSFYEIILHMYGKVKTLCIKLSRAIIPIQYAHLNETAEGMASDNNFIYTRNNVFFILVSFCDHSLLTA
jgi:hypothetical protein